MGWPQVEVNVMTVRDALHQFELEVSENENRKDFTFSEKMQWAKLLKDEYRIEAEVRQKAGTTLRDTCPEGSNETRDVVAEITGIGSGRTLSRAEYVIDHATPEIIQLLDEGDLSINAAYRKLKAEADALRRQNEAFIRESAEHSRQQKTLF